MRTPLASLALATALVAPADAAILCVAPGGGGGCHATIALALAAANDGDTIRVAAGTYAASLTITENVTLEGGWNATFTQRDPAVFVTTVQPTPGGTAPVVTIMGSSADPAASRPVLDGLVIRDGVAYLGFNHGGGLAIRNSHALVRSTAILENRAYVLGGGVWIQRGAPVFEDCRIEGNGVEGGGSVGGGVLVEDGDATFTRCTFDGNRISDFGGAGGAIGVQNLTDTARTVRVTASVIRQNSAGPNCQGYGGGISVSPAEGRQVRLFVDGTRFESNCGQFAGGGIVIDTLGTVPYTITNSVFDRNDGGNNGDALHVSAGSAAGIVRNATFVGVSGDRGLVVSDRLTITNSILRGYDIAISYGGPLGQLTATYNDFFGNVTNVFTGAAFTLDPTNLTVDPLLDATAHLMAGSPLIDAGTRTPGPFRDVDGDARPAAGPSGRFRLDIGADEVASAEVQLVYDQAGAPLDYALVGPGDPPEEPNDTTTTNEFLGYAALGADVTGDGRDDLVAAAEDFSNNFDVPAEASGGRLFGMFNFGARRTGALDLFLDATADLEIHSGLMRQHLGSELAGGDVNGDGVGDLVVGSFEDDGVGDVTPKAFVFFGGPALAGVRLLRPGSPADFTLAAPDFDFFAFSAPNALAAGDLDGGGVADIVVGDALADDGGNADAGAVFVVLGGAGLAGTRDLATTPADFTLYGPAADAQLGSSGDAAAGLALGHLDGDGALDLVARTPTTAYVLFGPIAPGVHRLATTPADLTITGLAQGGVIVGDLTGDGANDLVLGSGGELHVLAGPFAAEQAQALAASPTLVLTGAGANAGSLAFADVVGDPRPDLIVGSSGDLVYGGQAFVVAGGVPVTGSAPIDEIASAAVVESSGTARFFAWEVAAGDFDLDGRKDLVVTDRGAPPYRDHGFADANDAGRVYVVYGGGSVDNCPGVANPTQRDADHDGIGDACDDSDQDADGVPDYADNCMLVANAAQTDSNGDGYGNICDGDLNDSGGPVNFADLSLFRLAFGTVSANADLNASGGVVNFADLARFRVLFGSPAGPSGLHP
jgi:hypothetical protein